MDVSTQGSLVLERGASPTGADIVFVPVDAVGTPGELNMAVLSRFDLDEGALPDASALSAGYVVRELPDVRLVFVVTVDTLPAALTLNQNLEKALGEVPFDPGTSLWIPLMGMETGGLKANTSFLVTMRAIDESGAVRRRGARIVIAAPALLSESEFDTIRKIFDRMTAAAREAPAPVFVRQHLLHDHASYEDLIGFTPYAVAIQHFLTSVETRGPMSVSIQAPWGAGKSSLMKQVRRRLDPQADDERPRGHATLRDVLRFLKRERPAARPAAGSHDACWTIWFNAWKYESSEQVWAGLVDAIVAQVSDRLDPVERELFLLKLNLARIDDGKVRTKIHERFVAALWPAAAMALMLGAALVLGLAALGASVAGSGAAAIAAAFAWLWKKGADVATEPATFSLADYVRIPDYGKSVGVIHEIHGDIQRVVSVLPRRGGADGEPRLVIFVDDLDRCSPNKVASVVEGINMFLASDQRHFLFVIGMDPQIVAAALEHAHKDIKGYLPGYEQAVPLGWRFMDKFVQLAFTIPPRGAQGLAGFVDALLATRRAASPADGAPAGPGPSPVAPAGRAPERPDPVQVQSAASRAVTEESEDVLALMKVVLADRQLSPREIKRALNFVRFVLLMRIGRLSLDLPVPPLAQYGRWIVLSMRWPDMARWLQWSSDSAGGTPVAGIDGVAANRLLVLENAALPQVGVRHEEWCRAVGAQFRWAPGTVRWLEDPGLHAFFVAESRLNDGERLSRAASIGFY